MDAVAALLDGPRARDAFVLRATMAPPWSMRVEDRAPLAIMALVRGGAWIVPDGATPIALAPGDVAIARGPDPYVVADRPDTPPGIVIHEGDRCTNLCGDPLDVTLCQGVRTWGTDPDGPDVLLVGTYQVEGDVSARLLSALPPLAVVRAAEWDSPLLGALEAELARDAVGQSAVLDRLLDVVLVGALRTWFDRPDAAAPRWYLAHADPVVGEALRLLHHSPAEPWTVATLAARVGTSRAALARRFTELVGEPPMTYLAGWRISVAADRLREPGATLAAVAAEVGYSSPFALSAAFKRLRGVSPAEHRRAAAAGTVADMARVAT